MQPVYLAVGGRFEGHGGFKQPSGAGPPKNEVIHGVFAHAPGREDSDRGYASKHMSMNIGTAGYGVNSESRAGIAHWNQFHKVPAVVGRLLGPGDA